MGQVLLLLGWLYFSIHVSVQAEQMSSRNDLHPECLGNVVRLRVGPLLEEVDIIVNDTEIVQLSPRLAAQCGFRFKFDNTGNAILFASLLNCFSHSMDDETFNLFGQLRVSGDHFTAGYTCSYTWASREILCDHTYMEVSVRKTLPDIPFISKQRVGGRKGRNSDPRRRSKAVAPGYRMTKVVFMPSNKIMKTEEVQRRGYAIANTPTRLVLRSPHEEEETYLQTVAGIPMRLLSTSTFFEQKWLVTRIDTVAACPTQGSVAFTSDLITWYMPRQIDPLLSSDSFTMLEVYMGVDGKRLDDKEMAARNYSVSVTEVHIIVKIPVGAIGGYYKSHIQDYQYFSAYTIEPMLEMLWIEEDAHEDTRYKVLFPITTPLVARPPQVHNYTPLEGTPEQQVFMLKLGTFNLDVVLLNITFSTGLLTIAECNARGFNVQEEISEDDSSKTFSVEVPFLDPVVLQEKSLEQGVTSFTLHLIYGMAVLPEYNTFSHPAVVNSVLMNIVPPSITGICDQDNFYIIVNYENQAPLFEIIIGGWLLTSDLAEQYVTEGESRITLTVPFSARETVFESIQPSSVRSRLDVSLLNPFTNSTMKDFSLGCSFPKTLIECLSNGTMTALALKVASAPGLNPRQLTLADRTCGPIYSDDRFAYFQFTINSCGTTNKFIDNGILYENEISLPDELKLKTALGVDEEYHLMVSCYYLANITQNLAFNNRPSNTEPSAEMRSDILVIMKIATDSSYRTFHEVEDYPVVRYMRRPLHIEVEITGSTDPEVKLILDHCWATNDKDRTSKPRWNLIINGCENPEEPYRVMFHQVFADSRVNFPAHMKRFEVQMFSFAKEVDILRDQLTKIFIHCDVFICDSNSPAGGFCREQCVNKENNSKRGQRHVEDTSVPRFHVSSGLILGYVKIWKSKSFVKK
ncbi:hypothetical protein UPYG_G00276030 [Umbra pygmaea]|uniref:ZP domain-containing protein n=1 Tax=Umbra pygmaea TaxID=75934 RepID=A0ABD0W289_UMBPY